MTVSPFVSLPQCAVGLSVVSDCDIAGHTYLLFNKIESAISTFVDGDQVFKVICYKQSKTV